MTASLTSAQVPFGSPGAGKLLKVVFRGGRERNYGWFWFLPVAGPGTSSLLKLTAELAANRSLLVEVSGCSNWFS